MFKSIIVCAGIVYLMIVIVYLVILLWNLIVAKMQETAKPNVVISITLRGLVFPLELIIYVLGDIICFVLWLILVIPYSIGNKHIMSLEEAFSILKDGITWDWF